MVRVDHDRDALFDEAGQVSTLTQLAELLRRLRRRHGRARADTPLTYRELSAKTGWAHGIIGNYLSGKTLPPTDRFDVLIGLLGASAAEQRALATARDRVEENRRRPSNGSTPPRELPRDVTVFVGRDTQLAELDQRLAHAEALTVLSGTAGVGKTALAVHWAHR